MPSRLKYFIHNGLGFVCCIAKYDMLFYKMFFCHFPPSDNNTIASGSQKQHKTNKNIYYNAYMPENPQKCPENLFSKTWHILVWISHDASCRRNCSSVYPYKVSLCGIRCVNSCRLVYYIHKNQSFTKVFHFAWLLIIHSAFPMIQNWPGSN